METEYKLLEETSECIRTELDKLIGLEHPLYSPIWVKINELVNNEIELEGWCNL